MSGEPEPVVPVPAKRSRRQWAAACESRLKHGERYHALLQQIAEDGYSPSEAEAILDEAVRTLNRRAGAILGCSTILLVAGLVVTVASLGSSEGYIWFGAIICGGIGVIYGLCAFVRRR